MWKDENFPTIFIWIEDKSIFWGLMQIFTLDYIHTSEHLFKLHIFDKYMILSYGTLRLSDNRTLQLIIKVLKLPHCLIE